ncbi:MAG: hypothetical protein Q8R88_04445 [Desulfoprunum sp.]|nr:hypothetical protein [Desulfoprunum sp.]
MDIIRRIITLLYSDQHKNFSVLFPGDISIAAEKEFTRRVENPLSTLLLAPHHGSKTSNSPAFLKAVHPSYLIVSAGRNKLKYFPDPGLESLCNRNKIVMLTTARNGTVEVNTNGEHFTILRYSRSAKGPLPSGLVVKAVAEELVVQPGYPAATH